MYIFVILLSALFLGFYEVLKKKSLQKSSVNEVLFFYCLSAFSLSLVFIKDAFSAGFVDILFVLVKSAIIVVNWWLVLKCMKKLDVAIVVSFSLINTILVVFGSSIFFNEQITWIHFLSLLFIASGIMLITMLDRKKEDNKNQYQYILLLLCGNVLGTCSALLDKYLLNIRGMKSTTILIWFMFFVSIMYGVIYLIKNKKLEFKKLKTNYWMIFTGFAIALADITYYYSITMDGAQLSLISILRKMSVVIATILASLFLKEKNLVKKLGILFIMLIGVSLPIFIK